jgi:hypothetical protein
VREILILYLYSALASTTPQWFGSNKTNGSMTLLIIPKIVGPDEE